ADPYGRLYIGTDVGVFVSLDQGAHWAVENTGYANIPTEHLLIHDSTLYAFTHGRGAWRVALSAPPALPLLSIGRASSVEGAPGSIHGLIFPVTLGAATTTPVTVQYSTTPGTATPGSDYTAVSGTVTLRPGTTSANVSVPIIGDAAIEADESFRLTPSTPVGPQLANATAVGTIVNDDTAGNFSLTADRYTVSEAAAYAVITVRRTDSAAGPVTVDYQTNDGSA